MSIDTNIRRVFEKARELQPVRIGSKTKTRRPRWGRGNSDYDLALFLKLVTLRRLLLVGIRRVPHDRRQQEYCNQNEQGDRQSINMLAYQQIAL